MPAADTADMAASGATDVSVASALGGGNHIIPAMEYIKTGLLY